MYVYLITNTVNGKKYVGKTKRTVEWRWTCHVRAINRNFLGRSHSLETREKMRLAAAGRKHTEESLAKMRGRIFSAETRQKMSLAWDRRKARSAVEGIQ